MEKSDSKLRGVLYDVEYTNNSLSYIRDSQQTFDRIEVLLKRSVYLKQQIEYDKSVRLRLAEREKQQLQQQMSLESNFEAKCEIQQQSSNVPISENHSKNLEHSRNSPSNSSSRNAFNRFSTSFDFRNFPVSELRDDFRNFISQFSKRETQTSSSNTTGTSSYSGPIEGESNKSPDLSVSSNLTTVPEESQTIEDPNTTSENSESVEKQ